MKRTYTLPTGDKVRTTAARRYLVVHCLPNEWAGVDSTADDRHRAMARVTHPHTVGPTTRRFVIDQQTGEVWPNA